MKKNFLFLICNIILVNFAYSQNFGYNNPVISGMNPDPSICVVGEDYYTITSSFTWFPGVPIYHSKDLINWKMIGYCLDRKSNLDLSKGSGIYAPTLRYHNGTFYMVTTNQRNGGNFYVTTTDPKGPWSDPIWIKELGGIDPSLFFDDDGKIYFTTTDIDGIIQAEIDIKTGQLLTKPKIIWTGTGGRYPEGPHLYKINNTYYLLISEGGTEYGHQVVIAKSNNPWGPFEANPNNPILTHINKPSQGSPIQGTGHADLVKAHDGSWWMAFLAFRPVGGRHHHIGRETFLAPVSWTTQGWPLVNTVGTVDVNMNVKTLPQFPGNSDPDSWREDFDTSSLSLRWNYIRNPKMENYSLTDRKKWLSLTATKENLDGTNDITFVGFRQKHHSFASTTLMDFHPNFSNEEAGLSVYHKAKGHYDVYVTKQGKDRYVVLRYSLGNINHIESQFKLDENSSVFVKVEATPTMYTFFFSQDGSIFTPMGNVESKFISTETLGGFVGVYIGLYATCNGKDSKTKAYFNWVDYKNTTNAL